MKKKIVAMCATVAIAAVAVGGTLAYFTDTDSAVNKMVVGNLDIEVVEKNAAGEAFDETDYVVMPGEANKIDKQIWTILKDGSVDAYVRSIVLFEVKDANGWDWWWNNISFTKHLPTESAWPVEYCQTPVQIGDVWYVAACFYPAANNGILEAGESYCSINNFWFTDGVTSADIAEFGTQYSILTLSQAVQVQGNTAADNRAALNAEFGEVTDSNNIAKWFAADEFKVVD